jgi:hypothetical protein
MSEQGSGISTTYELAYYDQEGKLVTPIGKASKARISTGSTEKPVETEKALEELLNGYHGCRKIHLYQANEESRRNGEENVGVSQGTTKVLTEKRDHFRRSEILSFISQLSNNKLKIPFQ